MPGGQTIRYRYFRRSLEGPIADLERTFRQSGEDEGGRRLMGDRPTLTA